VEPLIKALEDENEDVRRIAAFALGRIGDIRAVEPLIKVLEDEDRDVRWDAAIALGRIGDIRAVEPLIKVLEDENEGVRLFAEEAIGNIGEPAIEPLLNALDSNSVLVSRKAAELLEQIKRKKS
jgi:HEAT repeat protein